MTENDFHRELADVRSDIAELQATVRVVKHDVANMQQAQLSFGLKLDKIEERLGLKIEKLGEKLSAVTIKHERGVGFFAGMAFIITASGGLLLALGKLLFVPGH